MRHLIIIPAYNEEDNLNRLINSLSSQTQLPSRLVMVDDGSTDATAAILGDYQRQYPWIQVVTNHNKDPRATGAKIVRAFNLGLDSQNLTDYDVVSKFDADLEFSPDYLERITASMLSDEDIGLTGGICTVEQDGGRWTEESVSKTDHIRGALKSYRVRAFQQMEGLRLFMGWDSADEFLLRYHGWKVTPLRDLHVRHHRETNELNGWVKTSRLNAQVFHNLGYGFIIGSLSALKRGMKNKPRVLSGLLTFVYFILGYLSPQPHQLRPEIAKFVRAYRRKTILS